MKRIKWKLTLWWRTMTQGPMCQRCETRHDDDIEGWFECAWTRIDDDQSAFLMRLHREMAE